MKVLLLLAVLLAAGCVSDRTPESFARLQSEVNRRSGLDIARAGNPQQASAAVQRVVADAMSDGRLTAEEAVRVALLNHAGLAAELEGLGIAQGELIRASLLPNPVLDASVRFVEGGGGEIIELGVAQNLLEVLLIPRRKAQAREAVALAEARAAAAVLDLAAQTRTAYRRYQAQLARVELYESVVDATYLAADMARRLREAGNIIELDVLQEDVLHREAKLMLAEARARTMQRREALNALLGVWGDAAAGWSVPPRLPEPEALAVDSSTLVPAVIRASLDLEIQRRQINVLGRRLGVEAFETLLPDLEAGAEAEREADGEWSVGPAVGVALPIFDTGQGIRVEFAARLRQAIQRYTALAVGLRASTRAAYTTAQTTARTSRYLREVLLPLRNQVTQQTQLQFNAMQLGVFRLLDAKRDEIEAAERYLSTLEDHWAARIRLETLQMGRLPQDRFGIDAMESGGGMSATMNNNDSTNNNGDH